MHARKIKNGHAGTRGFTFMEIIAGLAIMSVLVAIVTAGRMVHASVPAEAAMMKAHLRFAQSLAMADNTVVWTVQVDSHAYALRRDGTLSTVSFPGENGAVHLLPEGVRISGGTGLIQFNAWGAPDASRVVTISDDAASRSIQITGFTGLIP